MSPLETPPNIAESPSIWRGHTYNEECGHQVNGDSWDNNFFRKGYPRAVVGKSEEGQSIPAVEQEGSRDSLLVKKSRSKEREVEGLVLSTAPEEAENTTQAPFQEAKHRQTLVDVRTQPHNLNISQHARTSDATLYESDFKYQELTNPRMIRILKLLPGNSSDPLECVLETSAIDSEEPYEALSYVWGAKTDKVSILCHGKNLKIPQNLYNALVQLRHRSELQRFWADAICINQECDPEKNIQVPLMREIFKRAKKVLIWLGRHDGELARTTFEFARKVFNEEFDYDFRQDPKIWQEFYVLFRQPWFWRIWCFQEVVLAREADVLWGEARAAWKHIGKTAQWIRNTGYEVIQEFGLDGVYNATLMYSTSLDADTKLKSFLNLLMLTRQFEATKSVDKIYALLGIRTIDADPEKHDFYVQPAYEETKEVVYEDFAMKVIDKSQDLTLLSAVQHGSHLSQASKSWIPQWDQQYTRSIVSAGSPAIAFSASQHLKRIPPSIQDGLLVVHGVEVDKVARTSDTMPRSFASEQHWRAQCFWTEMVAPLNSYPNNLDLVTAFCWTLTAGKDWTGDSVKNELSHFADFAEFVYQNFESKVRASPLLSNIFRRVSGSVKGDAKRFAQALHNWFCVRRFFTTERGYIGIGPACMREGDKVCVLSGAIVPFIIRPDGDQHKLVGEAYVHGIMHGEACERHGNGLVKLSAFRLS